MKSNYNENYIKEAAYYNWQNAGCPSGQDEYFWNMAINQLYGKSSSKTCASKSCSSSAKSCTKTSTAKKTVAKAKK